jgi:hypothetical protein
MPFLFLPLICGSLALSWLCGNVHQVGLAPVFLDQVIDVIAALAGALGAFDVEHVELAFDVAED